MGKETKKSLFLFHGEDTYSSEQKLKSWKTMFQKKYGEDCDIEIFDGKKIDVTTFITNIEAVPFLSEKKLIILKDFITKNNKEAQKKVAEHLYKTADTTAIIFHQSSAVEKSNTILKKLKKIGQVEEFKNKSAGEITSWIQKKAPQIDYKTANYLTQHCGIELWKLNNEIEKLKTYAGDKQITTTMIDELTTPSLHASIFKLTDKIAEKNTKEALKILTTLNQSGEDLTRVFFMIVRQFRILLQVKEMSEERQTPGTISKKLKQHPFVIKKSSYQIRNFTPQMLERTYGHLLEIDKGFKTGGIKSFQGDNSEYKLAIEKLIIQCCK